MTQTKKRDHANTRALRTCVGSGMPVSRAGCRRGGGAQPDDAAQLEREPGRNWTLGGVLNTAPQKGLADFPRAVDDSARV